MSAADVTRVPNLDPFDREQDDRADFFPADDDRDGEREERGLAL